MKTIHMSLADLVKQSAFQICHLRKKPELKETTPEQIHGNELALEKSQSEYLEMRGSFKFLYNSDTEVIIHYAFDEILLDFRDDNKAQVMKGSQLYIEHKNIFKSDSLNEYTVYLYIMQLAAYAAFNEMNPNRQLQTAEFFIKEGNPKMLLKAKDPMHCFYLLRINNIKIDISIVDPELIVSFFKQKAIATLDYDRAKEWDIDWKMSTWAALSPSIKHTPVPWHETITRVLNVAI
jgi:hypothetical protein